MAVQTRVLVMLATYNGAPYLAEQLASLRAQRGVEVSILARDDGSTDGTLALLEREVQLGHFSILDARSDKALGAAGSFFELMCAANLDYPFFAFCDQDDVWMPGLLSEAVEALHKLPSGTPALHTCARTLTDSMLRPKGDTAPAPRPGLGSALVENIVSGTGTVLNRELLMLMRIQPPRGAVMHDWWAYLTASAFGRVLVSAVPRLYYRQHGRNVLGMKRGVGLWIYRLRTIPQRLVGHVRSRQAAAFLAVYGARLSDKQRAQVAEVAKPCKSFRDRWALACSRDIWRQTALETLLMRVMVLMDGL